MPHSLSHLYLQQSHRRFSFTPLPPRLWPTPLASPTPFRPSPSSLQRGPRAALLTRWISSQRVLGYLYDRAPIRASSRSLVARWTFLAWVTDNLPWISPRWSLRLHCAAFSNWTGSQGDGVADSDSTLTATSRAETICDGLEGEEFQRRRLSLPDGTFSSKRARRSRAVMTSKRGVSRRKPKAHGTMVSVVSR